MYVRGVSTRIAVCPGSYDPITYGHLDVIARAARMFGEVIVAVGVNPAKTPLISDAERKQLIEASVRDIPGVRVDLVPGLIADYCHEVGATAIVKGIRGGADYDHELPMALMNRHISGIETVFLTANPELIHISSSLVRELAKFGRNVDDLVPPVVAEKVVERITHG